MSLADAAPSVPKSCDPNEMAGPWGAGDPGTERFLKPGEEAAYTIYFENKADATAAAQEIRVTATLDARLDRSTFRLGEVAFRNQVDTGLADLSAGTSEVALADTGFHVRSEAAFDEATGTATWYLRLVDKSTATPIGGRDTSPTA